MTASPAGDHETKSLQEQLRASSAARRTATDKVKAVASAALATTPLNGTSIVHSNQPEPGFDVTSSQELRFDVRQAAVERKAAVAAMKKTCQIACVDAEDVASQTRTMVFDAAKLTPGGPSLPSPTAEKSTPRGQL